MPAPPSRFTFQYTEFKDQRSPNGAIGYRPILQARLTAGAKFVDCFALADSGADHCLFPFSFLKILGLNPLTLPMEHTQGVGSSSNETRYALVQIKIDGVGAPFKTFAGFTLGLETIGLALLGQNGFFENYRVTFSHATKRFHIDI